MRLSWGGLQSHDQEFDTKDLVFIHQMLHQYAEDIIVKLQSYSLSQEESMSGVGKSWPTIPSLATVCDEKIHAKWILPFFWFSFLSFAAMTASSCSPCSTTLCLFIFKTVGILSSDAEFIKLVGELGPPPPTSSHRTKATPDVSVENGAVAAAGRSQELIDLGLRNLLQGTDRFDTAPMEAAKFFYPGPATLSGTASFFCILHRLSVYLLDSLDSMSLHLLRVLGDAIHGNRFVLVV